MFTLLRKPDSAAATTPAHTPAGRVPAPSQQRTAFDFSQISVTAPLPHLDRVAAPFGADHPLSAVRAQVLGDPPDAAWSIGSRPPARGGNPAFPPSPDRPPPPHERAHPGPRPARPHGSYRDTAA